MKSKKFKYDGKSRPSNKLYKKNFDEIFGVKIKKDEEVTGYYYNGYEDDAKVEVLTEKKNDKKILKEDLIKSIIEIEKKAGKDLVSVILERKLRENNDKKK